MPSAKKRPRQQAAGSRKAAGGDDSDSSSAYGISREEKRRFLAATGEYVAIKKSVEDQASVLERIAGSIDALSKKFGDRLDDLEARMDDVEDEPSHTDQPVDHQQQLLEDAMKGAGIDAGGAGGGGGGGGEEPSPAASSARVVALNPTSWIPYVGTIAKGADVKIDLLLHELRARFHIDKLTGTVKAQTDNALDSIRAYLHHAATVGAAGVPSEPLIIAARSLWYGSYVFTHGAKTAEAWLARAISAPVAFSEFSTAFDALPADLKKVKEDRNPPSTGDFTSFRGRRRGGRRSRGGRGGNTQQGGQGAGRGDSKQQQSTSTSGK